MIIKKPMIKQTQHEEHDNILSLTDTDTLWQFTSMRQSNHKTIMFLL